LDLSIRLERQKHARMSSRAIGIGHEHETNPVLSNV
jgi:hypothetical protein